MTTYTLPVGVNPVTAAFAELKGEAIITPASDGVVEVKSTKSLTTGEGGNFPNADLTRVGKIIRYYAQKAGKEEFDYDAALIEMRRNGMSPRNGYTQDDFSAAMAVVLRAKTIKTAIAGAASDAATVIVQSLDVNIVTESWNTGNALYHSATKNHLKFGGTMTLSEAKSLDEAKKALTKAVLESYPILDATRDALIAAGVKNPSKKQIENMAVGFALASAQITEQVDATTGETTGFDIKMAEQAELKPYIITQLAAQREAALRKKLAEEKTAREKLEADKNAAETKVTETQTTLTTTQAEKDHLAKEKSRIEQEKGELEETNKKLEAAIVQRELADRTLTIAAPEEGQKPVGFHKIICKEGRNADDRIEAYVQAVKAAFGEEHAAKMTRKGIERAAEMLLAVNNTDSMPKVKDKEGNELIAYREGMTGGDLILPTADQIKAGVDYLKTTVASAESKRVSLFGARENITLEEAKSGLNDADFQKAVKGAGVAK